MTYTGNSRCPNLFLLKRIVPLYLCIFYTYLSGYLLQLLTNLSVPASSSGQTEPFASSLLYCIFFVCHRPPSSLFVPMIHISHVNPPLTTRRLNTSKQCVCVTSHVQQTLIHHITKLHNISSYTSSILLGRLAGPELPCWGQLQFLPNNQTKMLTFFRDG